MKKSKQTQISDFDIHLYKHGNHVRIYDKLGAHYGERDGVPGTHFAVWAPNAGAVHVAGDFNSWNRTQDKLGPRWDSSGIWEGFFPHARQGARYKYVITNQFTGATTEKCDPVAFFCETPPCTASIIWDLEYTWNDHTWMGTRKTNNSLAGPVSIYEVHLGSWRRDPDAPERFLGYREIAPLLVEHIKKCGFTHIEFLPVMEHPFYGSWGYQITGYYAPTSRFGTPQDFMYLVDLLHQNNIGIILDWVPSHFPTDEIGLGNFDGTHLYEHSDERQGFHPDWKSYIYNYDRPEVRNFLISNALFWLDKYHIDGLRVDAVASMLYLDYSRNEGEWIPNRFGGKENEQAIYFLRQLNTEVYKHFPDVHMIAEESTSWPAVSRPVYTGGLGFEFKWNMGWMHDILTYFTKDPIFRKYHQHELTFSLWYAFHENFILPLSHDEVVHGKAALLSKMPGDLWQKFANLRLLYGLMYTHPGKKLLFMGAEFGQWDEWYHEKSLDWHLLQFDSHRDLLHWIGDLNRLYRNEPSLYQKDYTHEGFEWIDMSDAANSIISFLRKGNSEDEQVLTICNCTPVVREGYRIGVNRPGHYHELLNSDAKEYGGSGVGNCGNVVSEQVETHGRPHSLSLILPPLGILVLKRTLL